MRVARLVSRQIVGILILVYSIAFWNSASRLPDGPQVTYPKLVIIVLGVFIVADLVMTSVRAAKARTETTAPSPETEPEPADGDDLVGPVADDTDAAEDLRVPRSVRGGLAIIWTEHQKTAVTTIMTVVYLLVIPILGFFATTALYLLAMFAYLGMRKPALLGALWVGSMVGIWLMFDLLLSVRLPNGMLL